MKSVFVYFLTEVFCCFLKENLIICLFFDIEIHANGSRETLGVHKGNSREIMCAKL